jgi:hypothetical protein
MRAMDWRSRGDPVGKALVPSVSPGKHHADEVPPYESTRLITV